MRMVPPQTSVLVYCYFFVGRVKRPPAIFCGKRDSSCWPDVLLFEFCIIQLDPRFAGDKGPNRIDLISWSIIQISLFCGLYRLKFILLLPWESPTTFDWIVSLSPDRSIEKILENPREKGGNDGKGLCDIIGRHSATTHFRDISNKKRQKKKREKKNTSYTAKNSWCMKLSNGGNWAWWSSLYGAGRTLWSASK